ncbi:MAG TPA: TonB-dependent receptor, partial [Telluria sp.]|nr:TonB-dependent receptor [Telluria sp.]
TADRGVTSWNGRPVDVDPSTFFGSSSISHTYARVDALSALVEHDLGQGALLRNRTRLADYDKFYQNVFAGSVVRVESGVPTLNLSGYNNRTRRQNVFNQTDLSFNIAQGALRHRIATGLELGRQVTDNYRNTAYFTDLGANTTAFPVRLADPSFHGNVVFRQKDSDADNHGVATVASAYFQDQLELSPHWQLIAGLRYDHFKVAFDNHRSGASLDHTDTPLAPRAGVVYKPQANVSVYGSYSVAYLPRAGDQLSSLSATNASFDPEQFRNLELGAKWEVQPGLQAAAAVYRLDRSNVIVPAALGSDPTSVLADGQRTKGVELGLSGRITPAWSIMGGYAWQDARLTADVSASARAGATLAQVPRHAASLWNRYDFAPGFGAGLGIVYRGAIFSSTSNAVTLPSFTRVDGALYWNINSRYRAQLNVENLFDKRYFASANSDTNITPGAPRNLRVTLNAAF